MLVSSHNDILQDFQELRMKFFQEIFRKRNKKICQDIPDGVTLQVDGVRLIFEIFEGFVPEPKVFIESLTYKLQESAKYSFHKHYIHIYRFIPPLLCQFFVLAFFFMLTGYFGQDDDYYFEREALNVHLPWRKI